MSSGLMLLPSLPVLPRLDGDTSSSLLHGLPSPPDSSVLLRASRCACCKHERCKSLILEGRNDKIARPVNVTLPHHNLEVSCTVQGANNLAVFAGHA